MEIPKDKKIIFFDGVCNLCSGAVQFIIKRDKRDVFRFAPLQGEAGQEFLAQRNLNAQDFDSIILFLPGEAYYHKSKAVLKVIDHLGGLWFLLKIFKILPTRFTDAFYDFVAKHRYQWFGRKQSCMIPTPELQEKFLEGV